MSDNVKEVTDLIEIDGVAYDKETISPSVYFNHVKGLKQKIDNDQYDLIIDDALKKLKKTELTGQTEMAKRIAHQVHLAMRELDVASKGFDIFVNRKDIEKYITQVDSKCIKIIELSKYTRDIPDEIIEKLVTAKELFDEIYIIFTDYTSKETKKIAKERRDKDPILFGAFHDPEGEKDRRIYVEDRLFFIADWTDDTCDLTLEEMVRDIQNKDEKDITYRVSTNISDAEAAKKYLESFDHPIEDMEPTNIFEKIKKKVTRKKSTSSDTPKKVGRPRKRKTTE